MDYTTLIAAKSTAGSVANWLNSAQLTAAAPTIVSDAEAIIYRRLRHWRMTVETTGSMSLANDFIAPPDTASNPFLEAKSLFITGVNFAKLTMKTEQEVKASYVYDGNGNRVASQPMVFYQTMVAGAPALKFDNIPDQTYPYELVIYQQPTPLATSITNFLTNQYPRLMRAACMVGAAEFMKDVGAGNYDRTYWEQIVDAEILIAQYESDRSEHSVEGAAIVL